MACLTKQVLVTGASGFLGAEIVSHALQSGWHVRTFSRSPYVSSPRVEAFMGDISNVTALCEAASGVSAIVHAAGLAHVFGSEARDITRFFAVNEAGTQNVVEAAAKCSVGRLVLVSSVAVYGIYPGATCDESATCHPQGHYAASKLSAELRAIERLASEKVSLSILRFSTIYGEGDRGNVAKLIGALDRGRFIWPGSGANRKSLIYKADAARACLTALDRSSPGVEIFNVTAPPVTMREIVTAICRALGRPLPRRSIPLGLFKFVGKIIGGLGDPGGLNQTLGKFVRDDVYNGEKFESAFDFHPTVALSEGIERQIHAMQSGVNQPLDLLRGTQRSGRFN